jgi:hypothetical protein
MEAPLCPICCQLNLGEHQCPEENFPGENKLDFVRDRNKRNARIEWKDHLRNEEEKNLFVEQAAKIRVEIRVEIDELNNYQESINELVLETIKILDFAKNAKVYAKKVVDLQEDIESLISDASDANDNAALKSEASKRLAELVDSRGVVDSNQIKIKNKIKHVKNLYDLFNMNYSKLRFATTHYDAQKQKMLAEIESKKEEFTNINSTVNMIQSYIKDNITIRPTVEQFLNQPKFAKDTPRDVKREDRGTGAKSSKDIHGIDGDDNGEYRRKTDGY